MYMYMHRVCSCVVRTRGRERVCVCVCVCVFALTIGACFITWKYCTPQYVIMHNFIIFKVNYINLMSNLMF